MMDQNPWILMNDKDRLTLYPRAKEREELKGEANMEVGVKVVVNMVVV